MTTTTAAVVLAWIAIVLLTLATAGLVRRTEQLSSRNAHIEPNQPVQGLQLPMSSYLGAFEGGHSEILLLFVSPSCTSCQTAIETIAEVNLDNYRVGVVTRESDTGSLLMPNGWVQLTSAVRLFQILHIPATPYLVRLGPDGLIIDATTMVGSLSLDRWLAAESLASRTAQN